MKTGNVPFRSLLFDDAENCFFPSKSPEFIFSPFMLPVGVQSVARNVSIPSCLPPFPLTLPSLAHNDNNAVFRMHIRALLGERLAASWLHLFQWVVAFVASRPRLLQSVTATAPAHSF